MRRRNEHRVGPLGMHRLQQSMLLVHLIGLSGTASVRAQPKRAATRSATVRAPL
jgi:hypothetical protein